MFYDKACGGGTTMNHYAAVLYFADACMLTAQHNSER